MKRKHQARVARVLIALGYTPEVIDFTGLHVRARNARQNASAAEEAISGYTPNNQRVFARHAIRERLLARFLGHMAESGRRFAAAMSGGGYPPTVDDSYPTRVRWEASRYRRTHWPHPEMAR